MWSWIERNRGIVASGGVIVLGLVLLSVPLYGFYADYVLLPRTSLALTVAEHLILVCLSAFIIGGGVWLATREWDDDYTVRVAVWTAGGTFVFCLLLAWIIGIQIVFQGQFDPLIIVGSAACIGSIAVFTIGIYDARRSLRDDRLQLERDRFSALFDNATDAIAAVDFAGDDVTLLEANEEFDRVVDDHDDLISDVAAAHDDAGRIDALADRVRSESSFRVELQHGTGEDAEEFIVQLIPYQGDTGAEAYIVMTDVTDQKQLAREVAARSRIESLHSVTSEMSGVESHQQAYELAMDAAERILGFEGASIYVDGDVVATRGVVGNVDPDIAKDIAGDDRLDEANGGSRISTRGGHVVLTTPLGERGVFQAESTEEFAAAEITAAELLVTHLDETLDRLDFEHDLREERERLELLNRILRHDLLDGMNTVRVQAQLLDGYVDDDREENRRIIVERVDDMVDLVETARSFMQTTVGDGDLALEPVRVDVLLEDQLDTVRTDFPNATFEADSLPELTVDANDLLGELFNNLLSNAVEHNDEATPKVEIAAHRDDGDAVIEIADNGPGIAPADRERLFERGQKGAESSGTGLGLYLCREIADSYGGSVDIRDSELGGAKFIVRIPLSEQDGA